MSKRPTKEELIEAYEKEENTGYEFAEKHANERKEEKTVLHGFQDVYEGMMRHASFISHSKLSKSLKDIKRAVEGDMSTEELSRLNSTIVQVIEMLRRMEDLKVFRADAVSAGFTWKHYDTAGGLIPLEEARRIPQTANNLNRAIEAVCTLKNSAQHKEVELILRNMFDAALGIYSEAPIATSITLTKERIMMREGAKEEEMEKLRIMEKFVDEQNGEGAFAAALCYPMFNTDYKGKRKICYLGFESNTGKGLLLHLVRRAYANVANVTNTSTRPSDGFSSENWAYNLMGNSVVTISDTSQIAISYDDAKNLLDTAVPVAQRGGFRAAMRFTGSLYVATNNRMPFFEKKELRDRAFYIQMDKDIDKELGHNVVDSIGRVGERRFMDDGASVRQFMYENWEKAQQYWTTYETPASFYACGDSIYDVFMREFGDRSTVSVREIKDWTIAINRKEEYKELKDELVEFHGKTIQKKIDGKNTRCYELREEDYTDTAAYRKAKEMSDRAKATRLSAQDTPTAEDIWNVDAMQDAQVKPEVSTEELMSDAEFAQEAQNMGDTPIKIVRVHAQGDEEIAQTSEMHLLTDQEDRGKEFIPRRKRTLESETMEQDTGTEKGAFTEFVETPEEQLIEANNEEKPPIKLERKTERDRTSVVVVVKGGDSHDETHQ